MATASDLLAEVEAAISDCLKTQQWSQRGRSIQKAELRELRRMRRELIAEINESGANGGSMLTVGEVSRPS